jgi:hypothetical protein
MPSSRLQTLDFALVDWIRRSVLIPGDLTGDRHVPWPGDPDTNADRFAQNAGVRTEIALPGDICWFDTGPAHEAELAALRAL